MLSSLATSSIASIYTEWRNDSLPWRNCWMNYLVLCRRSVYMIILVPYGFKSLWAWFSADLFQQHRINEAVLIYLSWESGPMNRYICEDELLVSLQIWWRLQSGSRVVGNTIVSFMSLCNTEKRLLTPNTIHVHENGSFFPDFVFAVVNLQRWKGLSWLGHELSDLVVRARVESQAGSDTRRSESKTIQRANWKSAGRQGQVIRTSTSGNRIRYCRGSSPEQQEPSCMGKLLCLG